MTRRRKRECPPPGIDTAVLEAVTASDAQFFIDHPGVTFRVRDFVPGEGPPMDVPTNHRAVVHVTQVEPGFRLRAILIEGPRESMGTPPRRKFGTGQRFESRRLDPSQT
jgi:hypothetical protein